MAAICSLPSRQTRPRAPGRRFIPPDVRAVTHYGSGPSVPSRPDRSSHVRKHRHDHSLQPAATTSKGRPHPEGGGPSVGTEGLDHLPYGKRPQPCQLETPATICRPVRLHGHRLFATAPGLALKALLISRKLPDTPPPREVPGTSRPIPRNKDQTTPCRKTKPAIAVTTRQKHVPICPPSAPYGAIKYIVSMH